MISQLHMAKSAMFAFERRMQNIVSNISNAETVGYKRKRVEMESLFPLAFERAITEFEEAGDVGRKRRRYMEYGQGVKIAAITRNFEQGTIEITNQPLDMAISRGSGLFQVRLPDGRVAFSRAGNFHLDAQGTIVDPNGHPMEPQIRIPRNATDIIINEEGKVFVLQDGSPVPQEISQIQLAKFQNPAGLRDIGQNLYVDTASSGEASFETPGQNGVGFVQQRALEFSNVNVIEEMMNMILTQRAFEVVIKAINSTDSMLKTGSDIK